MAKLLWDLFDGCFLFLSMQICGYSPVQTGLCFKLHVNLHVKLLPSPEVCIRNVAEYEVSGTMLPMWQSSCDLIDSYH